MNKRHRWEDVFTDHQKCTVCGIRRQWTEDKAGELIGTYFQNSQDFANGVVISNCDPVAMWCRPKKRAARKAAAIGLEDIESAIVDIPPTEAKSPGITPEQAAQLLERLPALKEKYPNLCLDEAWLKRKAGKDKL